MTAAVRFPMRSLLAGCGLVALLGLSTASEELTAQHSIVGTCSATVTFVASQNACPTAPIGFRIAVPQCEHSSGSFDYEYIAVNQIQKATVHRSADWSRGRKMWDQTEHVPLACDEEIYEVMPVGTPHCVCSKP